MYTCGIQHFRKNDQKQLYGALQKIKEGDIHVLAILFIELPRLTHLF